MESTSDVVYDEQAKSSVTKKCIQEVSTVMSQKISSSSLVAEKDVMSIVGSKVCNLIGNEIISMPNLESPLSLPTASPTLPDDGMATTSLQSEFSALKIKDDFGNKIVQQKQQQQSVQASSTVTSVGSSSSLMKVSSSATSSSSKVQQSSNSIVVESQESLSSSNTAEEKPVSKEPTTESTRADKQLVEKEVLMESAKEKDNKNVETPIEKKETEEAQPISATHKECEEIAEEVEELQEDELSSDGDNVSDADKDGQEKRTEELVETPNGTEIKTTTVTTVTKVLPDSTTTIVTNSSQVTQQKPSATASSITTASSKEVINKTNETAEQSRDQKNSAVSQDINSKPENVQSEEDVSEEETDAEEEEDDEDLQVNEKIANESAKPVTSLQQQQSKQDQIEKENGTQPITTATEETVVDAPSAVVAQTYQHENKITNKQENLNNTIKDIISNIDDNIQAQENIAALKERELELLKKQQELALEIEQQQILAQKLANENQYQQQRNNNFTKYESDITPKAYQPITNVSKYCNFEEKQDNNIYSRKSETFETRESTNVSKKIDLQKIFTPATDAEEILPKNRKLYASSAFYSPSLHPTVEDQVALARRISHSLSDISNHQSRGQSMYVNRKKRSVKWIHEGAGQDGTENENVTTEEECEQEERKNDASHQKNTPLKFLMNPSGQMRDINSLRESINTETGLLSPDVSAEVVHALQTQRGKGAELFAKRRKVAERWVVDENNVGAQSPSGLSDYHQYQQQPKLSTSPSILPAYTDAAKHRVLLNLHQEQLLEKYARPGLKVVQTPWEAALNSGSASAAFVEEQKLSPYPISTLTPSPTPQIFDASQGGIPITSSSDSYTKTFSNDDYQQFYQSPYAAPQQQAQQERQFYSGSNSKRELAYKPSIPQGWRAPSMSLPKVTNLVEVEKQYQTETNFTDNKIKYVQQHQHITTINEAAKSCEEFNTKDETELINLIYNKKKEEPLTTAAQSSKLLLNTQAHEFVNHLIKSPELRVSPIPIRTQVIYDNAVQELNKKQLLKTGKTFESCELHKQATTMHEENEKVNVRKQLQQYENLHRQYAKQIEKEEQAYRKREAAKLKALQQNTNKVAIQSKESLPKSSVPSSTEQQNEKEYTKVPVKELITNFEQQCLQEENSSSHNQSSAVKDNINFNGEQHIKTEAKTEDLYMPKEIPLQSYAPPPVANIPTPVSPYETNQFNSYRPAYTNTEMAPPMAKSSEGSSNFPVSKPYQQGFSSTYGSMQPPKQQYLPPQSYQKVPQNSSQNMPQVNFNPSPLPYDKLAKFENPPADEGYYANNPATRNAYLNVRTNKVRNTSPAPFAGLENRVFTPSSDSYYYGGTPSVSPRPVSSTQHYSGHNTPNLSQPSLTSNQLLNAPSYNTSARGWGCGGGVTSGGCHYQPNYLTPSKPQIVNASSMPYTDF